MMAFLAKGYSLFSLTVLESTLPFVRMMILSRALPLRELGFVSALTATLSTFEQMTDFAIYRFLFSVRREKYEEALASAHTLSVLRGVVVGSLAVAAGPLIARGLSLSENWLDFSLLGLVIFIRSFDHLAPRVAERDYRYGVQLKVSGIAYAAGTHDASCGTPDHTKPRRLSRLDHRSIDRADHGEPQSGGHALPAQD